MLGTVEVPRNVLGTVEVPRSVLGTSDVHSGSVPVKMDDVLGTPDAYSSGPVKMGVQANGSEKDHGSVTLVNENGSAILVNENGSAILVNENGSVILVNENGSVNEIGLSLAFLRIEMFEK